MAQEAIDRAKVPATLHGMATANLTDDQIRVLTRKPRTSDFHVLEEVGSGSYSDINLCRDTKNRRLVAMKVVSARTLKKEKKTAQAGREKDVLAASSECQNIIDLYSTFYDQQMETLNFVIFRGGMDSPNLSQSTYNIFKNTFRA